MIETRRSKKVTILIQTILSFALSKNNCCFFFLFHVVFNNFFKIPVESENARVKLALAIHTSTRIKVAKDATEMLLVVTDKTINDLSKQSKEAIYFLRFLLINSLSLIFVRNLSFHWFYLA